MLRVVFPSEQMLARDTLLDNRYRVIELLGTGAMGSVYLALDERLSSNVAVKGTVFKQFRLAPEGEASLRRAFEREAKLLANLQHETIPRVIDFFAHDGEQYLVMEYIAGEDLYEVAEKMRKKGENFDVVTVSDWTFQLLDALHYLHTQPEPVIHKDIKLSNLKITNRGRVKLLDFGISKGYAGEMTKVDAGSLQMGTEEYAPIEQYLKFPSRAAETLRQALSINHADKVEKILQQATDARSDLYSLAVTVYRLLSGRPPADYLPRALAVWEGGEDPLVPVHELNKDVPAEVSQVLMHALALEQEDRPASAAEMVAEFQAAWREHHQVVEEERRSLTDEERQREHETIESSIAAEFEARLQAEIARREAAETALAARDKELNTITSSLKNITDGLDKREPTGGIKTEKAGNGSNLLSRLLGKKHLALLGVGVFLLVSIFVVWHWSASPAEAQDIQEHLMRGKTAIEKRNFDEAINAYSQAISINPASAHAFAGRADAYYKKNEYDAALADLDKAISLEPQNAASLTYRAGVLCQIKQDYDRAFADFAAVEKIDPNYYFLYDKRGFCHESRKDYDKALADYNKAIELNPDVSWTHYRRGVVHLFTEQFEAAAVDFTQVLRLSPDEHTAYNNRAAAYSRLGKRKQAAADLKKYEELKKQ
jgi:eukaryotic-like serine/threonine-protein kinase